MFHELTTCHWKKLEKVRLCNGDHASQESPEEIEALCNDNHASLEPSGEVETL